MLMANARLLTIPSSGQPSYGVSSNNPVLRNITDYLIEEASAEEEELLGVSAAGQEDAAAADTVERDDELVKVRRQEGHG